jgi:uncharacterized OB-fold protein
VAGRVVVRQELFTDPGTGVAPALLGSRCAACGSTLFPRADACTYCATEDPDPVELSGAGTLWAWTAVTAPPPGYLGEVPFGIGVVELPEGVRVIARLTESDPAALEAGRPMELRIVTLHRDNEGNDVVTYAFAPTPPPAGAPS